MDRDSPIDIARSACPHDCPSTCALEIERLDARTIGRVHGARDNSYTAGVVCAKVARYAERTHHPDRLRHPLRRTAGGHERLSWDDALDEVAEAFLKAERTHGAEAVWPYFYAGTMGLLQRDGIERLRHAMKYSGQHSTICTTLVRAGWDRRDGRAARPRPARDGARRPDRLVGRQPGLDAGQRDDPHPARAQAARREAGRRRSLPHAHRAGGRRASGAAARHRRRARLRRHARAVPRRPCRPRFHGRAHRLPGAPGTALAGADSRMGGGGHRPFGG